jgi:hypothetical protein
VFGCTNSNRLTTTEDTNKCFFTQRLFSRLARCSDGCALPLTARTHFESEPVSDKRDAFFRFAECLQVQVDISSYIGILLSYNNTLCLHSGLLFHSFRNKCVHSADKHLCLSTLHQLYNMYFIFQSHSFLL